MTGKLMIIAITGIVAVASLGGPGATAFAGENSWVNEHCGLYNSIRAFDFAVRTESTKANAVSGVTFKGKLCGTGVGRGETYEDTGPASQYVHVKVRTARGVEYNSTDAMAKGMYVGKLTVDAFLWFTFPNHKWEPWAVQTNKMNLLADKRGSGDCPVKAKACYRGVVDPTQGWYYKWFDLYNSVWVTESDRGRYSIHIGEIRSNNQYFREVPFGILMIDELSICANAGASDSECGDSSRPFVRKNGDASPLGCPRREGVYRLRARNREGAHTNSTRACVPWR